MANPIKQIRVSIRSSQTKGKYYSKVVRNGDVANILITAPKPISAAGGGGGGVPITGSGLARAKCLEDAPADGNVIDCYLYDDNGAEIEVVVPVTCNISSGEIQQVDTATPANVEVDDIFSLIVALDAGGTDQIDYTATNTSISTVCANLASKWNLEAGAEFARVTAQSLGSHVRLTADTAGEPFTVTATAVDGGAGADTQTLTMATTTANSTDGLLTLAIPRLKENNDIFVTLSTVQGDPDPENPSIIPTETKYFCVTNFNAFEPCVCQT
jgi:hypothetical protein